MSCANVRGSARALAEEVVGDTWAAASGS
ncbi:hypothetical protein STPH1_3650 [Streptomyces sp. OM5714]|nr:hypothetical protein STPH1_3650 [Streptomyces sp. OM5714]